MLSEGESAPAFELPALVDGSYRRVALEEFLGDDVVILAFYPGDFNPACDETACDLDELDLFTMQKDVAVLGISPDSVYSHRAFAERYDLKVPLLSDTDHEVAERYGVDFVDDIGQRLSERAVAVVDHDGVVQYTWSTTDPRRLPDVGAIKDAIADTGGDDTAFARYRIGHAHFTEGRRAFTSAMGEFSEFEWMMAQGDFRQAREEFEAAADHFDTAARFVDDADLGSVYEDALTKANALWQAADWLATSAREYSSGNGVEGQELREDAEGPLETARGYHDPPDPDEWPPDVTDLEREEKPAIGSAILPEAEDREAAALGVDIDAEVEQTEATERAANARAGEPPADGDEPADADSTVSASQDDASDEETIDDAELAAIHAELEANNADPEPAGVPDEPTSIVDQAPADAGAETTTDDDRRRADADPETNADTQAGADATSDDQATPADGDADDTDADKGEADADDDTDDETTIDLTDPTASDEETES